MNKEELMNKLLKYEKILNEIINNGLIASENDYYKGEFSIIQEVIQSLEQLEEPEVLSQEWIDEHKKSYTMEDSVEISDLQNLLVPKQEKVDQAYKDGYEKGKQHATEKQSKETDVLKDLFDNHEKEGLKPLIPQFMHKTIDFYKRKEMSIFEALTEINEEYTNLGINFNVRGWIRNNFIDFVNAYEYDYEVEKEQKYNVKFKVKSSFGTVGIFLYKEGDEVLAGDNFRAYYPNKEEYMLTEQEIRGFQNGDVLFEHFAVRVEEVEE